MDRTGLEIFMPRKELRPYVEAFYHTPVGSGASPSVFVGGPGITVDLWWLRGPPLATSHAGESKDIPSGAVIGGALTRMLSVSRQPGTVGVGVSLAPAVAPALFGLASCEIRDRFVGLDELGANVFSRWTERIWEAESPRERVSVLEDELLDLLGKRPSVDGRIGRALERLTSSLEDVSVDGLARDLGVTRRRFLDLVRHAIGTSPNELIQILRFRKALKRLQRAVPPDWMDIVFDCGYFDQSHFIRHCRKFTGLPPKRFLEKKLFPPLRRQAPRA